MNYLVPAWHRQLNDWALTIPMIEFDDATNLLQILRDDQQAAGVIVTDYQPQLSTTFSQFSLAPTQVWSVFDYLQGINHLDSRPVDYRELSWPADAVFDTTSFRAFVISQGRRYAGIFFDTQGKILWIEYYQSDGQLDHRLLFDSRGFVSREEQYENGQPAIFTYLDEQGHWRIRHDQRDGRVTVNPQFANLTEQAEYDRLSDLVEEVVRTRFLPQLKKNDHLIVSLDDNQLVSALTFAKRTGTVFSASRWHPYRLAAPQLAGHEARIVADSASTAANIRQLVQLPTTPTVIPIFQTEFKLGHSQRSLQQRIAVFAEYTSHDDLEKITEQLYQMLLADPDGLAVDYLVYSPQKEQEVRSEINALADRHEGEFEFKPDHPDENENDRDLEENPLPQLDIKAARLASTSDVLRQLDKSRIMIDWSQRVDDFMQVAVISVGIPQVRSQATDFLKDGENGIVADSLDDLPESLNYYLGSLRHWNAALASDAQFLNQYSEDNLLKQWQQILTEEGNK